MSRDRPSQEYLQTSLLWEIAKRGGRIRVGGDDDQLDEIECALATRFDIHVWYRETVYESSGQNFWRAWLQWVRKHLVELNPPQLASHTNRGEWSITPAGGKRLLYGLKKGRDNTTGKTWLELLDKPVDLMTLRHAWKTATKASSRICTSIDDYIAKSAGLW